MFITFEGPEGGGKSTHIAALAECLRGQGYSVLLTREPGGTAIGDQIRSVLMNLENTAMHPRAEILLFQASRAQLVEQVIRPALAAGKIILCDRYADSTLAYQGYGHQMNLETLRSLIHFATGGLKPDLTLLLDLDVEVGLRRRQTGGDWNRLDAYEVAFHRRVRQGFEALASAEPNRWVRVDASDSLEAVQTQVCQIVQERLRQRGNLHSKI